MADQAQFEVELQYTSVGSTKVQAELDRLQDKLDEYARTGKSVAAVQPQISAGLLKIGQAAAKASTSVTGLSKDLNSLEKANQKIQATLASDRGGRNYSNYSVNVDAGIEARQREAKAWSAVLQTRMKDEVAAERQAAATQKATDAANKQSASLPTLRYALYDVSTTIAVASASMVAFSALSLKAAIDYERAFANVIRTNDGLMNSQVAAKSAFEDFVNLAGEIPMSFQSLSQIGTLAGQLGVATGRLEDFTRTTAQFSTVTGESIETTATAFGRLDALLPDVQGNYDALGSSILNVGINSVATEGQVISITTQLAGIGSQAGLTADELIGLSGALASVGIQPELARGTITRLFGQISRAVSVGGDSLEGFARISGSSADEFSSKWSSNAMGAVLDIFRGIQSRGSEAEAALRSVGITSVRDVPAILRLAQTVDTVLVPALEDAKAGFDDGTQLADNYGVIAETTASRLQVLGNNFQSLLASLGEGASVFKGLIDVANGFLEWMRELQKNPITAFFSQLAVVVTGVIGVLGLLVALTVRGAASFIGLQTAMMEASKANITFGATATATSASLFGIETRSKAAILAVRGLGLAFKALTVVGASTLLMSIATTLDDIGREARESVPDVTTLSTALQGLAMGSVTSTDVSAVLDETVASFTRAYAQLESLQSDGDRYVIELSNIGSDFRDVAVEFENAWASATTEMAKQDILDAFEKFREGVPADALVQFDTAFQSFNATSAEGVNLTQLNAEQFAAEAQEIEALGDAMSQLVDDVYSTVNAHYDMFNALSDVGDAFVNEGAAVAFTGSAMQNAIKGIIEQSGGAGSAAANLQVLFDYLVQGGFASAAQLTQLQSVIAGLITTAGGKISAPTMTAADFSGFTAGVNNARQSMDRASGSADKLKVEIRTLLDYASDLAKVWNRAFDIRFSGQETLDTISSQFIKIREENDRAAEAIRNLRNDIRGLNSDISIQEYYLSIAIEYGDTLRAEAIEAELEKTRAALADKTAELQVEQDKANKSLVGNTAASIENRDTITGLISAYQKHIEALAASGASQDVLLAETARLKAEFIAQAAQLGYNQAELALYASAFDDVTTAINLVPRNITVAANTNPAVVAFNEMQKAINDASNAASGLRNNLGSGFSTPPIQGLAETQRAGLIYEAAGLRRLLLVSAANGILLGGAPQLRLRYLSDMGYANGGYTGAGGKYEPAGVVHRGEYVIPKRDVNQTTGRPYADALGRHTNGVRGYATGGYVRQSNSAGQTGAVALTAGTIQALAQAVQQYIVVDGRVLGETTSNAYAQSTAVGAN